MRGRTILVGLLILLSAGLAFATATSEGEAEPIKFGGVWPLADITGNQGSKSAQIAVDELNAGGGLLGRPVELVIIDSEFSPEKGATAIERPFVAIGIKDIGDGRKTLELSLVVALEL